MVTPFEIALLLGQSTAKQVYPGELGSQDDNIQHKSRLPPFRHSAKSVTLVVQHSGVVCSLQGLTLIWGRTPQLHTNTQLIRVGEPESESPTPWAQSQGPL